MEHFQGEVSNGIVLPRWEYQDLLLFHWPEIIKKLGDFDILMIGQNHGLPHLNIPGEGLAMRFGMELITRMRSERLVGFVGIEEFLHPKARPRPNRWDSHEIGPYQSFCKAMGIEIVPVGSVYSDPSQREEEIATNILEAYQKYGRGIVVIGAHHAIRLTKPIADSLSGGVLDNSALQLIKEMNPEVRIVGLVCLKDPNLTNDIQVVVGPETSSINVMVDENQSMPLGGVADMAVLFPK